MNSKKRILFFVGLAILVPLILCGCIGKKPNYGGTMDGYRYYYAEGRDRLWEEDILYMAEKFLGGHPRLSDSGFMIQKFDIPGGANKSDYTNELFDESLREEFIKQVNLLIPRIADLDDFAIRYEAMRIVSILEDIHSNANTDVGDLLPICFQSVGDESENQYCTVRTTEEHVHLLGSRLTAINGIPIEEIVSGLASYTSHENEYGIPFDIARPFEYCFLTQKPALCAIGVVSQEDESAQITFSSNSGDVVETIQFVPAKSFGDIKFVNHYMVSSDALKYSRGDNYWYTVINDVETPYMYVRFNSMWEQNVSFQQFYTMVASEIKNSDVPLRLIIDFRDNGGGELQLDPARSFANAVNRYTTNGTYILINGGCYSAGMLTPYALAELIDGAKLVGSPTGQPGNCFGAALTYNTPNYQMMFWVSDNYIYGIPEDPSDAVYPDVTVYQTWEDYRNNVDTVLEYCLD